MQNIAGRYAHQLLLSPRFSDLPPSLLTHLCFFADLMVEMNEENIDDIDFSKYWSDYDTWGYDKRALGSMKRKKAGQPFNEMKKKSDIWAYDKK